MNDLQLKCIEYLDSWMACCIYASFEFSGPFRRSFLYCLSPILPLDSTHILSSSRSNSLLLSCIVLLLSLFTGPPLFFSSISCIFAFLSLFFLFLLSNSSHSVFLVFASSFPLLCLPIVLITPYFFCQFVLHSFLIPEFWFSVSFYIFLSRYIFSYFFSYYIIFFLYLFFYFPSFFLLS